MKEITENNYQEFTKEQLYNELQLIKNENSLPEIDLIEQKSSENELMQRKKAEEEARKFKLLTEASGQGVGISKLDRSIVYANPELLIFLHVEKLEDVQGTDFLNAYSASSQEKIKKEVYPILMKEGEWTGELELQSSDEKIRHTLENLFIIKDKEGNPQFIADIMTDITERKEAESNLMKAHKDLQEAYDNLKQMQEQLVQSEKMASLGQLTAGIAHELNNPINFVGAGATSLEKDMEDLYKILNEYEKLEKSNINSNFHEKITALKEELEYDYLKNNIQQTLIDMKMGASRISEIVKSLRNFTRLDENKKVIANIHEGI